ncbi:hypothetical protein ACFQYP_15675 [Nonomuraea antimicrobica]
MAQLDAVAQVGVDELGDVRVPGRQPHQALEDDALAPEPVRETHGHGPVGDPPRGPGEHVRGEVGRVGGRERRLRALRLAGVQALSPALSPALRPALCPDL